jgi:hypothetical protein
MKVINYQCQEFQERKKIIGNEVKNLEYDSELLHRIGVNN